MSEINELIDITREFVITTNKLAAAQTEALVITNDRLKIINQRIDLLFKIREKNA